MVKTTLLFEAGTLYFRTGEGIGFNKEYVLTMSHTKAQIGSTPFNIGFTQARYENYTDSDGEKQSIISIKSATLGFNMDTDGNAPDFAFKLS